MQLRTSPARASPTTNGSCRHARRPSACSITGPGGIRQQFKAALPLVEQLLRSLKQLEGLKGPLKAEIWDDGDAVGAWYGDSGLVGAPRARHGPGGLCVLAAEPGSRAAGDWPRSRPRPSSHSKGTARDVTAQHNPLQGAVLFPTAPTLDRLQKLADSSKLLLIINPQVRMAPERRGVANPCPSPTRPPPKQPPPQPRSGRCRRA